MGACDFYESGGLSHGRILYLLYIFASPTLTRARGTWRPLSQCRPLALLDRPVLSAARPFGVKGDMLIGGASLRSVITKPEIGSVNPHSSLAGPNQSHLKSSELLESATPAGASFV
jgi:hypothetical protein